MAENIDIGTLNFDSSKVTQNLLKTRQEIDRLKSGLSDMRKEMKDNEKQTKELEKAQEDLAAQGKASTKEYADNKKRLDDLTKAQKENTQSVIQSESQIRNLSKEQRELNKIIDIQTQSQKDNTVTMEAANQALQLNWENQAEAAEANRAMYAIKKQLNPAIAEEAALMEELAKRINESDEYQKQFNSTNETRVKGIGNYKDQILEAISATTGLGKASKGAIPGLSGITAGAQAFSSVPLFTIVMLLVNAFKFFSEGLGGTQKSMDALTRLTEPLKAIFQALVGVVQNLGSTMISAFKNPKQTLTDLSDFIKNNIMNRFKAFGVILEAIQNRDFKALRNGIAQAATGIENLGDKIINGAKAVNDLLSTAAENGRIIAELGIEIDQLEADYIIKQQKIESELRKQEVIAKDTARSTEERARAVEEQTRLSQELVKEEQKILDLKIRQMGIQHDLNDTSRADSKEYNQLLADRLATEDKNTEIEKRNLGVVKQLRDEANRSAADAARRRTQEALELQKIELETFALLNEKNKENIDDELSYAREISKRKQEILDAELKNKSLSQQAYDLASLRNTVELAEQEAEISVFYATQALNDEILLLEQKRSESNRLTLDSFNELNAEINRIADEQRIIEKERLDANLIDRHEYNQILQDLEIEKNAQLKEIDTQWKDQNSEDEKLRRLLENESILLNIEDRFEMERELELQRYEEQAAILEDQKANGLISEQNYLQAIQNLNASHAEANKKIDAAVYENKVKLASDAFGQLSAIAGEQSAIGKGFAIAQATIDTYSSAVASYNALSGIPIVGPVLGAIAAAAAVASGLGNVKKIVSTNPQKKYTGGYTGGGGVFTKVGDVHAGEVVFSQRDVAAMGGASRVESMRPTSETYGSMPTGVPQPENQNERWFEIAEIMGERVRQGSEMGTNTGMVEAGENEFVKVKSTF